jgi:hypothetical protein
MLSGAPLSLGKPKEFCALQEGKKFPAFAFNCPPLAAATIPVTLLHPIFRQFIDNCARHVPTTDDNKLVLEFSSEISKFYDSEVRQVEVFREMLNKYGISLRGGYIEGTLFITNVATCHGTLCYVLAELKNELCSGGADPLFKVALYYIHSVKK